MTSLEQYGWKQFHAGKYIGFSKDSLLPGRIVSVKGFKYILITEKGEMEAELSGKLLYGSVSEELPKCGDWVLFLDYDTMGYIIEVLPRINALTRKNPGTKTARQVLASNIDHALIVQALDRDFNIMRLERYLVQISACGIKASVILNKSDLVSDPTDFVEEVRALKRECAIYLSSTYSGDGLDEIRSAVFEKGKTYMLMGSSGVGKSSLLNALMRQEIQQIQDLSDVNKKGKHTTTTRDLFLMDNGSLIIDTPGMRAFGLTMEDDTTSSDLFPAIDSFAEHCHFGDCSHINEPGCAVIAAVDSGEMEEIVYRSYLKLVKEQRRFEIKASDKKRLGKQMGKMVREAKAYRDRYKGG